MKFYPYKKTKRGGGTETVLAMLKVAGGAHKVLG